MFAAWMRRKTGNHDVALVADTVSALHHVAYYVAEPSSVVALVDACADAGFQDAAEVRAGPPRPEQRDVPLRPRPERQPHRALHGRLLRDIDLPPIRWSWEDYDHRGRLYWSPGFPARFMETCALNDDWVAATTGA